MEAKQGLKVIDGGDSNDLEKQYPPFNNKQSGIRAALQIANDNSFTADDIEATHLGAVIAGRFPEFSRLSNAQQKLVYPWIEKLLCDCIKHVGILPSEDLIITYVETLCAEAATIQLPGDPHNGDLNQVELSASNEKEYTDYFRLLREKTEVLRPILDTWLAVHYAQATSLSNIGIQDNK